VVSKWCGLSDREAAGRDGEGSGEGCPPSQCGWSLGGAAENF